ncbi:MAG: HRDC domain-containing protein [Trueperaceae bacterium]|nr:HRDC domain-containing protein [Trueperaceae bacterium]
MSENNQRLVAYILIALGALTLLQRITGSAGWLIVGVIAVAFLAAYISRKHYGLLITGAALAGISIGILLEGVWGLNGSFLISLGAGFFAIDAVERKPSRWPIYVAAILAGLGIIIGLVESGLLTSIWFAILLILGGIFLILRKDKPLGSGNWVHVNPATPTSAKPAPTSTPGETPETNFPQAETVQTISDSEQKQEGKAEADDAGVSNANGELVKKLELWRRETAKEEGKAAYLVLTNESLELIAQEKPQNLDQLADIKGIGKVKLERYGTQILELLKHP